MDKKDKKGKGQSKYIKYPLNRVAGWVSWLEC